MQHALGLQFNAKESISAVAAISKFSGIFKLLIKSSISLSCMCLLSSLRCAVIPSAPYISASNAARNGLGYISPRAFLTVATWSILTPNLALDIILYNSTTWLNWINHLKFIW